MLRKGYVLLRRVFLFTHLTQIPPTKTAGRPRAPHPAPRTPARSAPAPGPPPQGPRPGGSPKPPAAAAAPGIPAACPEARRGPPAAEPAPSPGRRPGGQPGGRRRGLGGPGERGSRALNPPEGYRSKTLVPRPRRCGGRRRRRGLARASAAPGSAGWAPGPGPRPPAPGKGAPTGLRGRTARPPAGKSAERPHRASLELPPPWG